MVEKDEVHGRIYYHIDNTSSKAGNGETGDEKFTLEIEGPDGTSGIAGNETIPDGYPHDFCPVYPGSDLLLAQAIIVDKETMYTIALVSKDDEDKVFEFYNKNPNVAMTIPGFAVGLESKDGKMTAQIQVSKTEEEHAAQGYKTFVMKTLMVTE